MPSPSPSSLHHLASPSLISPSSLSSSALCITHHLVQPVLYHHHPLSHHHHLPHPLISSPYRFSSLRCDLASHPLARTPPPLAPLPACLLLTPSPPPSPYSLSERGLASFALDLGAAMVASAHRMPCSLGWLSAPPLPTRLAARAGTPPHHAVRVDQ